MKDSRDRDDARHAALRQDSLETERQPGLGTSDLPARFRLSDLLAGLSVACDLGFGLPPEEAMRSCLVATALRLAPFCTAALADSIIERDLGLDGVTESVIYACGAGTRPPNVDWAPWPEEG